MNEFTVCPRCRRRCVYALRGWHGCCVCVPPPPFLSFIRSSGCAALLRPPFVCAGPAPVLSGLSALSAVSSACLSAWLPCLSVCLSPIINGPLRQTAFWETVATFTFTLTLSAHLTHAQGLEQTDSGWRFTRVDKYCQALPTQAYNVL